jgi:hypothetical protein
MYPYREAVFAINPDDVMILHLSSLRYMLCNDSCSVRHSCSNYFQKMQAAESKILMCVSSHNRVIQLIECHVLVSFRIQIKVL